MNSAVNELVKSAIDKSTLEECNVDDLQQLVQQFPYFAPAQFLLAKKLKQQASPLYEQQSRKAILYFQDQLWFDYLSGEDDGMATLIAEKQVEAVVVDQPVTIEESVKFKEIISGSIITEVPETEEVAEERIVAPEPEQPVAIPEEIINPVEETPAEPETPEAVQEEAETEQQEEIEPALPDELIPSVNHGEKTPAKQFSDFKISPMDKTAAALTFEPYHTVDYFASQGIRFREEEKPKDRFGQQLKSFTDWLKTMKKAPDTGSPAATPPDDKKVTQMAEHSIVNRDVVTEAMAEVWEKQENHGKAIEIYRKLSLLNPAKSSYFAAKIEHLKNL